MTKVDVAREIAAPPQTVYDYFDDHKNSAEIFPQFSGLEWDTPLHEVGTRLKVVAKSAGISLPMVLTTTEVERGRRLAGTISEGMEGRWEWRFVPTQTGTRVEGTTEYELPLGILGQIADRLLVERETQADLARTLAILKEKTEAR